MRKIVLLSLVLFILGGCRTTQMKDNQLFGTSARVVLASGVQDKQPLDNLEQISLSQQKSIYIYVSWLNISQGKHTHFFRILDGRGTLVFVSKYEFEADQPSWNTWSDYTIKKNMDKPGIWTVEVYLDNKKLGEKRIKVIP